MPTSSFDAHIRGLADAAFEQAAAAAVPGAVTTVWGLPELYPVGTPLYDPTGIAEAMDRSDLNELCVAAYDGGAVPNGGRIGHVVATKMAIDHMAVRERALHARHATPVRLRAWRAARLAGHANAAGVFGAFAAAVGDIYGAATAVPNSQS